MALITRPSTAPSPHNMVLSGNFSKEILTQIRIRQGVAHGLPRLARLRPKPSNPLALPTKLENMQ
jgi:hypothetical protein